VATVLICVYFICLLWPAKIEYVYEYAYMYVNAGCCYRREMSRRMRVEIEKTLVDAGSCGLNEQCIA